MIKKNTPVLVVGVLDNSLGGQARLDSVVPHVKVIFAVLIRVLLMLTSLKSAVKSTAVLKNNEEITAFSTLHVVDVHLVKEFLVRIDICIRVISFVRKQLWKGNL